MATHEERPAGIKRLFGFVVVCLTAFLLVQLISLQLSWPRQVILGGVTILIGLLANRLSASRVVTVALMLISLSATLRYAWWRVHLLVDFFSNEANQRINPDAILLLLLISAEIYTIVIMVLGYMQTAWPLRRTPIPLPASDTEWPHVDLLIPTYNEPLSLVRYTALAALNIDYPPDKLHVYILDDGTRDDFSKFAAEAGVGYIIRKQHGHAKAGNINHALTLMSSPYVAIFDCDHVPTRSFLQMTLGWMLADGDLGMLQTPHHFYSPDPFERNLLQYKTIPNEAELFYGIVQDGNDFWNATFFCGSCALIRRAALDSVGGIATETVTEDAHTSLRMQKKGYNTAYINIPQAAGLATESLAAHVGQRIRWARGMIQILRTENPLFGRGLKFAQRLCYFNAMIHFMYAVPRLAFLLAPLAFLLLGRTIIPGYWVAILAYAFPHLVLASLTNSRVQGRHRHSFWNEIYESVLAPYILAPTLLALINPKLGKFNVTSKGNTLSETQFDKKIATPTRWLLALNFIGLLAVPYRLFVTDPQHPGAVMMNMIWVIFNIVILGVAAAVALEQKQRRGTVRIEAKIPIQLTLPGGRRIDTTSVDMSVGGASLRIPADMTLAQGDRLTIAFPANTGDDAIQGQVVGAEGELLRIAFLLDTIPEQEVLTRALYSRADAWIESANMKEVDRPLVSLGRVIVLSAFGIGQVCRNILPRTGHSSTAGRVKTAGIVLAAVALGTSTRTFAAGAASFAEPGMQVASGVRPQQTVNPQERSSSDSPSANASSSTESASNAKEIHSQLISLKEMGVKSAIEMRGPHAYSTVHFTLSHQLVPKEGTFSLAYALDPTLDPQSVSLQVSLNGNAIDVLRPGSPAENGTGITRVVIPISGLLLVRNNTLTFEFKGSERIEGQEKSVTPVPCRIFPSSTFEVTGDWLRLGNDLARLPLPFLDSDLQYPTTIPFVFLTKPTPVMLQAAGAVASWLGLMSGSQPVRFSVSLAEIPPGNAVVFSSDRSSLPAALQVSSGSGPVLAIRDNPADSAGSLLILAANNDADALSIARTLSLTRKANDESSGAPKLTGDTVEAPAAVLPPVRNKDDAPQWLRVSKSAHLTSCSTDANLQTDGSSPIPVYFHAPPDLFYGEKQFVELHLNYRYDAHLIAAGSALRLVANGMLVSEIPLPPGAGVVQRQRTVLVPITEIRPYGNTFLFNFDFVPLSRDFDANAALSGEILCTSTLDLHGLSTWTEMPNLNLFANAGFPFTQFADLSRTVVVLPSSPAREELSLYLHLMSYFGTQTGYPALRVTVTGPEQPIHEGRDYLVMGTTVDQPAFGSLASLLPATFEPSGLQLNPTRSFAASIAALQNELARRSPWLLGDDTKGLDLPEDGTVADAAIQEFRSPASPDRSIVTIALRQSSVADEFSDALLDPSRSSTVAGSLVLVRNSTFSAFASNAAKYGVGDLSWFAHMRIYVTRYFLLLLIAVLILNLLCARVACAWMAAHARQRLALAESVPGKEPADLDHNG